MKMNELKLKTAYHKENRKNTLAQLEKQLKLGTKPNRGTTQQKKNNARLPLTDDDRERIEKEIAILKTRI